MTATGKITSIRINGEEIGIMTEYETEIIQEDEYTWIVFCAWIYSVINQS